MRVVGRTKLLPSFSDDSHEGDESLDFDDDDDDDDDDDEDNVKRKPSGTLIAKVSRLSATIFNPVTTNNTMSVFVVMLMLLYVCCCRCCTSLPSGISSNLPGGRKGIFYNVHGSSYLIHFHS